ncbi:hypothetical protein, partial [Xanthomonas citri]
MPSLAIAGAGTFCAKFELPAVVAHSITGIDNPMNRSLLATTIASCLVLTACGGGGGGNVRSDAPQTTVIAPTPTTPPPAA